MPAHMRALPKPKPGTARAMQRARARLAKTRERAAKNAAKLRDAGRCRVPGCCRGFPLHAMHIRHAGIGGDPTGLRSWKRSDYVTGCEFHHYQQHAGYMRFHVGPQGGDGRVQFEHRWSLHDDDWTDAGWSESF